MQKSRNATIAAMLLGAVIASQAVGQQTVDLPGDAFHPEGIAYDSGSNSLFVSAAGTGAIVRIDQATGDITEFAPASGAPFTVLGLEVHDGTLWAAGAGTGEIRSYALADGAPTGVIATGEGGLLNDLTVSSTGDVYVTDSTRPTLYRVTAGSDTAEEWLDFTGTDVEYAEGVAANGIVITPDDAFLIVAQLDSGQLWLIDTSTKSVTEIDAGTTFPGADGLVLDGQTLYVIQNSENMVSVVELDASYLTGSVTAELTDASFVQPATGALVNGQLYVTNTQFGALGGEPVLPFTLTVLDLAAAE